MFEFGKAGKKKIDTLHEDLQLVLMEAIKTSKIDFCVYCINLYGIAIVPFYKKNPHIRWKEEADFKKVAKHIMATAKKMGINAELTGDYNIISLVEKESTDGN